MESSSPSSISSHYANLITTISDLKSNLKNTIIKMNLLEEQNITLQTNYQLIKDELIETRKKYNEAKENYMSTATAKLEIQKQSEEFIEKIKFQLAEKTKEFEQHRDKYTPQDIEYVRIQVQEDLEVTHRQKIQTLEGEIQKQRDLYYGSRRELERFKTEFETLSQSQQRELILQRDEYENIIFILRKQISELQLHEYTPEKDDKLRVQRIKLHELESIQNSLESEITILRRERDESLHNYELAKGKSDETIIELRNRITILEGEIHGKDHRINLLTTTLASIESQYQLKKQSFDDMEKRCTNYQLQLKEYETRTQQIIQDKNDEIEHNKIKLTQEYNDLFKKYELNEKKLLEREDSIRKLYREMNDLQYRTESQLNENKRNYYTQINELKHKNDSLEIELNDRKENWNQLELQRREEIDKYERESERYRSEISRLQREKEIAYQQNKEMEEEKILLKNKHIEKVKYYEELLKDLRGNKNNIEREFERIKEKYYETKERNKILTNEMNELHEKHQKENEIFQVESEKRYEELGKVYRMKLEDMKEKMKKTLQKERKRGDTYKEQALTAYKRNKLLSNTALALATNTNPPTTINDE